MLFFAYPPETTNAIESQNMSLRKVIKTRGSFPSQEAAMKLLYVGLADIAKNGQCRSRIGKPPCKVSRFCSGTVYRPTRRPNRTMMKESEPERFWEGGLPQTPEIFRFAPGFLAREASCARPLGIPAP